MTASIRSGVALAVAAVCPASFIVSLWLFYAYFSSHPTRPNNARGFVHALNNHGSYVYISDEESTGLALLRNVFFVGAFAAFATFPKDPTLAPPGTARWLAHFYVARKDFDNPPPRF